MKAILEFDLPEDDQAFKYAANVQELVVAINGFDQALRQMWKYEDKEKINIDECRNLLREHLNSNLDLDIL